MRIEIVQGRGGFAGEDLHRIAHRRMGPMLARRLGPARPEVVHSVAGPGQRERWLHGPDRPDVVVLPAFREHLWASLAAASDLAEAAPDLPVILSGWGAAPSYLEAIGPAPRHARLALALGEPEEGLLDALEALATCGGRDFPAARLGELGLAVCDGRGGWSSRGRFRQVRDPGELPSPYLDGAIQPADTDGTALVEVARGCRFRCGFCLSCNFDPPGVRPFRTDAIAAEIEHVVRAGARTVALLCSALNHDASVLEALADVFDRLRGTGVCVESTVHASLLDARRLRALERLPWRRMVVGLQSVDPEAARLMGRAVDPPRFAAAVERLAALSAEPPLVELIAGLPGDTLRGFLRTVRFALDLPAAVEVYSLRLDPGSLFFRDREALGLRADFGAQGRVVATPTFPEADLRLAREALRRLAAKPWRHRARSLGLDFEQLGRA